MLLVKVLRDAFVQNTDTNKLLKYTKLFSNWNKILFSQTILNKYVIKIPIRKFYVTLLDKYFKLFTYNQNQEIVFSYVQHRKSLVQGLH